MMQFFDLPTQLIWQAAGSPHSAGVEHGMCRVCGQLGTGALFAQWVRDTFTDHDKLYPGTLICHACQFCCEESSLLLAQRVRKEKPQRMRNYSHFVSHEEWVPLSKGEKRRMRDILLTQPPVAVIAESGQKHLVFRARLGFWQFEEHRLLPCPDFLQFLLEPIEHLYQRGASKTEIETGDYSQRTLMQVGVADWRAWDMQLMPHRGGLPLKLAVFLAQKGKPDDA